MHLRVASEPNLSFYEDPHSMRLSTPDRRDNAPWQPALAAAG